MWFSSSYFKIASIMSSLPNYCCFQCPFSFTYLGIVSNYCKIYLDVYLPDNLQCANGVRLTYSTSELGRKKYLSLFDYLLLLGDLHYDLNPVFYSNLPVLTIFLNFLALASYRNWCDNYRHLAAAYLGSFYLVVMFDDLPNV